MKNKKLIKNIIISLFQQLVGMICGLIIPRAIIGAYGSSTNGLINSITQFLTYIVIAEAGVGAVVKSLLYKPIADKNKKDIEKILKSAQNFFKKIAFIFFIYIIALCIIYPKFVLNEFDVHFTRALIIIIAISSFVEYFYGMIYSLFLEANQKKYIISIIQTISIILNTIITIVLIKTNCSVIVLKIVSSCIFILRPIIQKVYVEKKYKVHINECTEKYVIKQKGDAFAHQLANVIHNSIDVFLITIFMGTIQVSVYMVYKLVLQKLKKFTISIMSGVSDLFGTIYAKQNYEELNNKFKLYEFIYFTIITILFNLCLVLIIPFAEIYTKGITDANYYQPVFAIILTLSEFIWAIRFPANELINAVGHFKQTKKMAIVEAGINVILSIILMQKLGLIGIAIGTFTAMIIRGIYMVCYFSKNVLKRTVVFEFKCFLLIILETVLVSTIGFSLINKIKLTNYIEWIIFAFIYCIIITAIIGLINIISNKKMFKEIISIFKSKIKKVNE